MKSIKLCLVFFFLSITCSVKADDAFKQLDAFLSSFKSMSANFKQTVMVRKGMGKSSRGNMALERPGKFRWETTSPNHQIIIADGKLLWFYDVDLEQATRQSLTKNANNPASLLNGSTQALEQRFTIINSKTRDGETIFRLKPRKSHDLVEEVELQFKNQKLNGMVIIDNLGQKTLFKFSEVKINPKLSPLLFRFVPPQGVDILKQ
jgi:outer membrane lipoprotein carrier protein